MVTAFDANVWDLLDVDRRISTADMQRAVDSAVAVDPAVGIPAPVSAVDVPVPASHSDADLEDDVEASGDHSVEPGGV